MKDSICAQLVHSDQTSSSPPAPKLFKTRRGRASLCGENQACPSRSPRKEDQGGQCGPRRSMYIKHHRAMLEAVLKEWILVRKGVTVCAGWTRGNPNGVFEFFRGRNYFPVTRRSPVVDWSRIVLERYLTHQSAGRSHVKFHVSGWSNH